MAVRHYTRTFAQAVPPAPSAGGAALSLIVPPETDLSGALCRRVVPDVFFPEPDDTWGEQVARAICELCPVRSACLALALARNEPVGIYAGLTPVERDALAGRTNGCGTRAGYARHRRYGERTCAACRAANHASTLPYRKPAAAKEAA